MCISVYSCQIVQLPCKMCTGWQVCIEMFLSWPYFNTFRQLWNLLLQCFIILQSLTMAYLVLEEHVFKAGKGMCPHGHILMLDSPHGQKEWSLEVCALGGLLQRYHCCQVEPLSKDILLPLSISNLRAFIRDITDLKTWFHTLQHLDSLVSYEANLKNAKRA